MARQGRNVLAVEMTDGIPMIYALVRDAAHQFLSDEQCPALVPAPGQVDVADALDARRRVCYT